MIHIFIKVKRESRKPNRVGEIKKCNIMANFYCEYCGIKYPNVATLTLNGCHRHPNGTNKGKHKLYEGTEKSQYTCKYCGIKYHNIGTLTLNNCHRHPEGRNKGRHARAL